MEPPTCNKCCLGLKSGKKLHTIIKHRSMRRLILWGIVLLISNYNNKTLGQEKIDNKQTIKIFMDCEACDFSFVRQELEFISFVRDPKLADVHILLSESKTGSLGKKYFLNFIGLNSLKGFNNEYEYISNPMDTDDAIRRGLLHRIKTGLLQYYSKAGILDQIEINLNSAASEVFVSQINDVWDKWVFKIEAGTEFQLEERNNEYSLNTEFKIKKVTEEWKTQIDGDYESDYESYLENGAYIISAQHNSDFGANYIKSLNPRWSAGLFGGYISDTYINIKKSSEMLAGIEYNIFPWDISNQKVFTIGYKTGVKNIEYNEESIYNKLTETLFFHTIELSLELVQPWGTIDPSFVWLNYFHDFSKNKLTFDTECAVRLSKQFSVFAQVEAQVIHDQLYLPKGNLSLEDVLLKRRKQATTYEIKGEVGIQFTFGSIYNNVINERF